MSRWLLASVLAATLFTAHSALGAGVPIEKANKEQLKAAQRTFEAADGLFDAKRYSEAITAYRASYEIVASPNSRLMIARSLTALGRLDEAYSELVGAVNDAKSAAAADSKYEPTLKAAETELASLEPKIGRVEIALGAALKGARVSIGSRTLSEAELAAPVVVTPGKVSIVAALPDGRSAHRELDVAAGATEKAQLDVEASATPPPPPPAEKPQPLAAEPVTHPDSQKQQSLRPYAYLAGGVGVAGIATFAIFGLMNKSKYDNLQSNCPDGHCGASRQDDIDAGRRFQTIANIGLAVGVVGLGAGTTLFFLSKDSSKTERSTALSVRVAPGFAALGGSF